jgi:hypothetical protein
MHPEEIMMSNLKVRQNHIAIVLVVVVTAGIILFPLPVGAAYSQIIIGNTRTFETYATNPVAEVAYQLTEQAPTTSGAVEQSPDMTLTVQQYVDGLWIKYAEVSVTEQSGRINLFDQRENEFAGTYRFRLSVDNTVSPEVTVIIKKSPTSFNIGMKSQTGKFYTTGLIYSKNDLYYLLVKEIAVINLNDSLVSSSELYLQRYDSSGWVTVSSYDVLQPKEIERVSFSIKQSTPLAKQYRVYAPETNYVTGGTSEVFTVKGTKQSIGLTIKYSGKQRYKKSALKLTVKTSAANTGTAVVYDGKKKIKSIAIRYGEGTGKLPKDLKKGTHKFRVTFVPGGEYKGFYNSKSSAVKKVTI